MSAFLELKLKITELEKALNLTVSHGKEPRTELNMQKPGNLDLKGNLILNHISIVSV